MTISLVVAMDENGLIGNGDKLPWYLPADMKHFRYITVGKNVLMGRKTYESLGEVPLPNRKNIILSKSITPNYDYFFDGEKDLLIVNSIEEVIRLFRGLDIYVIGGAEIYRQFMNFAEVIYMTQVHGEFEGNTYFPLDLLDYRDWNEVETTFLPSDYNKNLYDMTFRTLKRSF
jgi:dihydrofolate reductase